MKTKATLLLLCLLVSNFLFAQSSLTGKITDNKNKGIHFATIVLYNQVDSTIVNSATSNEDGIFELKAIKAGAYFLKASMISYEDYSSERLSFPQDHQKNINIELAESTTDLATVEVVGKLPLLEQRSDRLIVNVENNMTSLNGSVLDVMKKVPGMIVTGDQLRMAGSPNVTILINGRTTKYMDMESLLRDMPGDNIKKIEVIHQPGAEFEAEGTGPIINIILKKNSLYGTNGSITAGIAKGNDWKYKTNLALSHYQGSVNIHGNVSYRDYPWWDRNTITRKVDGDIYEQVSEDPGTSISFNTNLGLDWDITEKHKVGFSGRYLNNKTDNLIENITNITFAEGDDLKLVTTNYQDEFWNMLTFNPYYTFEIDTSGQKLEVDFNTVKIESGGESTITGQEMNFETKFPGQQFRQPGESMIWTAQLDYTYPFSKDVKLQVGGKYSDASLDNNLGSFNEVNNEWVNNTSQSNHFIFDEEIQAAYSKLTWGKDKWTGTLGLRYEGSYSEGYSVTLDSTLTRDIRKLFPSVSLGREITKDLGATIAYSYRIDRPRYSSLNPFRYFLDPYTYRKGNPNLLPALTHSTKFSLAYQSQPFFNVEYKHTNDVMIDITGQDDATGESFITIVNLENFKNFNASLFFPLDFIPGISGYGGFIANYGKYEATYLEEELIRSKWDYTGFLSAEFTLPGEIKSEVSGWYNSGGQEGIINADWLYGVDIGFSKKFMEDKLKISFGVDNIFAKYMSAEIKYANMDIQIADRWDGPVPNLQVSYKFGNQHMQDSKRRRSSASEEINRAQK